VKLLITGGAGSIGSAFALHMARIGHDVRVMDVNEEGLWGLQNECPSIDCRLGDVQYHMDVFEAMQGIEVVVHCAAYKHVHLCERARNAAYRVNVEGTKNVLLEAGSRRFVLLSTDKAIGPVSIMGQSKQAAEIAVRAAQNSNIVRFGNVIGSRGSLVPAVQRYAEAGRPIQLTDPSMTRFMMTIDEAVGIITDAVIVPTSGMIIGPKELKSARIGEFVEVCRDRIAPGMEIEVSGRRIGEAQHESFYDHEGKLVNSNQVRFLLNRQGIGELLDRAGYGVTMSKGRRKPAL